MNSFQWIINKLAEDGHVKESIFFAVQETREDGWDYGSYIYEKAVAMLKEQGSGLIAVINTDNNVCEKEIEFAEIARKKYYEETEDGSRIFRREIETKLENGEREIVLKESVHIPESDKNFPEPEKGDALRLYEVLPFGYKDKLPTGFAIYDGEYFETEYA